MNAFAMFWMQQFTICYLRQGPSVESGLFNFFYSYISNINNASFHILLFIYYREAYISVTLMSLIVCFSSLWFIHCLTKKKKRMKKKEIHRSVAFSSSLLVMDSFSVPSLFSSLSVKTKLCPYAFRSNWLAQFIIWNKKAFSSSVGTKMYSFFFKYNSKMNKTFL